MIKLTPVEFEGADEHENLVFRVKCLDGHCSEVEITTPVTPELWKELSQKVHEALVLIHKNP